MLSPLLFVLIGVIFGFLAALAAFLITYEEYKKHYPGGNQPFRIALQMATLTFLFFVGLAIGVGYLLSKRIF